MAILQHVADDLVRKSHVVKENFKQVMATLNRRPNTSQELVSAEEFLNLIDTETLDELLRDVAEIKKRLGKYSKRRRSNVVCN